MSVDRKAHWDAIYDNKLPTECSWYQAKPLQSLAFIAHCGLTLDAPMIDVGGGASVLVDHLLDAGYSRLAVLDIAAPALACARARLGQRGHEVMWLVDDVTRFVPPHAFALWHDRAVFHFLTDAQDRRRYVAVLKQAIPRDGHVIIAAFAPDGPTQCSGLDIVQYDRGALSRELGEDFEFVEAAREAHLTPTGKTQHFGYFRFKRL